MSPVQKHAASILLKSGRDLVVQASTGSGKTLSFILPIISQSRYSPYISAIIIVPTRELAVQTKTEFNRILPDIAIALYGGTSTEPTSKQYNDLLTGVSSKKLKVVVATCGRLLNLLKLNELPIGMVRYLVLDEADCLFMQHFGELRQIITKMRYQMRTRENVQSLALYRVIFWKCRILGTNPVFGQNMLFEVISAVRKSNLLYF